MSVTVIYCTMGYGPRIMEIDGTTQALRDLVGGFYETDVVLPGIAAVVNENYDALNLPANRWIHRGAYNGAVVFVGSPRRGVPYRSLATDDLYALCEAGYLDINEFGEEDEHGDRGV